MRVLAVVRRPDAAQRLREIGVSQVVVTEPAAVPQLEPVRIAHPTG